MKTCWSRLTARCTARRRPAGTRSRRENDDVTPANPEQEPSPLSPVQNPDPWGIKRVENLITGLTGVLSARVVVTPLGEVSEVHVLTRSDIQPKQVVRNIESALMAQLR